MSSDTQTTAVRRPIPPVVSDSELTLSACAGSAEAFESIVRRHNRLLFRTARGIVSDDAEAQDVVQETYLRAFTNLQSFRGESALGTWLARIAINVALTTQRKKGRLVHLHETEEDIEQDSREEIMALYPSTNESPDATAERGEIRKLLQHSIEELPAIYRSVFILRAVEDLSVEETAFCLSVREDVVKTRFHRARTMLRDRLADQIELNASTTFSFAGARCDEVLAYVIAQLVNLKLIRLH